MYKIGFIGLGKLGYPVAAVIADQGFSVMGYDVNVNNMTHYPRPYRETAPDGKTDFNEWYRDSNKDGKRMVFASLEYISKKCDIIFVAVQTPHDPKYEGVTRIPDEKKDFDYTYLKSAINDLAREIKKDTIVVIISTVLPGTIRREILPMTELNEHIKLCYNPFFIAMGTTIHDFMNPEFILLGTHDQEAAITVECFYKSLIDSVKVFKTNIENAELIKVAYNTYIGQKIVFANTMMEICDKIEGCDVDEVTNALSLATDRLMSPKYLSGGMGDGGGCHPRDNIALSWLAEKLDLSCDIFEDLMLAREMQTEYLVSLMLFHSQENGDMPMAIFGYSFKPETTLIYGSPALLLNNILYELGQSILIFDPYIDIDNPPTLQDVAHVIFIGTKHPEFTEYEFPKGSIIIDPWRYIPKQEGVTIIGVGRDEDRTDKLTKSVGERTSNEPAFGSSVH